MKTILNSKGYGIDKNSITKEELEQIKKDLTVKPNVIPDYDFGTESYPVYRENSTRIYLPKYYGIKKYGEPDSREENEGKKINLKFEGKLRPYQTLFCDRLMDELKYRDGCVGHAVTGSGKTIMALWLLARLNKKTLIIVHKEFLLNQWIDRIKQVLPKARIGIIQQKKVDVANKDIVIGMLQSISMREYPKEVFSDFHLSIYDESHHICSRTFSKALYKIPSKKILSLSATPQRKDGLTKVLNWFSGDIISSAYKGGVVDVPSVEIIEAEYDRNLKLKYNFKGKVNHPDLINQIANDEGRNRLIVNKIVELVKTGRQIILLSDRRKQCEDLKNMLELEDLENEEETKTSGKYSEYTVGLYLGSMKEEELNKSNDCDIILASYSMCSEGFDCPKLDTLIMATGKSSIEQSVGRILRRKNEHPPLIIDIVDPKYCIGQMRKRKAFYKKKGFIIIGEPEKSQPKQKKITAFSFRKAE